MLLHLLVLGTAFAGSWEGHFIPDLEIPEATVLIAGLPSLDGGALLGIGCLPYAEDTNLSVMIDLHGKEFHAKDNVARAKLKFGKHKTKLYITTYEDHTVVELLPTEAALDLLTYKSTETVTITVPNLLVDGKKTKQEFKFDLMGSLSIVAEMRQHCK